LTLYSHDGDPSNMNLTSPPTLFPAVEKGSRDTRPKENMVLKVIDYANAISALGITQRLAFFKGT
jgi:hypothetical protein